jgi:methionyl-tRNA formyltransferase
LKIEILNTAPSHPVNPYLSKLKENLEYDHSVSIIRSPKQVTNGDLLFLVSCNVLVDRAVTERFKHALVLHASDLPKGRGWSPHIWELLNGADCITVSLLDAAAAIDCGDIYKKITVDIPRSALWDEINDLIFSTEIQLIEFAIKNFENLKKYPQNSDTEVTYYPKRNPKDSEIDPNKPISEQFDLIRACDPNRFPARFYHRGEAYKIILEKL